MENFVNRILANEKLSRNNYKEENQINLISSGVNLFDSLENELIQLSKSELPIDIILLLSLFNIDQNEYQIRSGMNLYVQDISNIRQIEFTESKIKEFILDVLVGYFNQRNTLLNELMRVELIHGDSEKTLLENLYLPEKDEFLSSSQLALSVQKI